MQLVPITPTPPSTISPEIQPQFQGPLMERIVYELHHNPSDSSGNPNPNAPNTLPLQNKINQIVSDLHHHTERHTLPYWPNSNINPTRVEPFWPEYQDQYIPTPPPKPIEANYPINFWIPYYSATTVQQKLSTTEQGNGTRLYVTA